MFNIVQVSIPFSTTNNLAPAPFFRADPVTLAVNMELNCSSILTTKSVVGLLLAEYIVCSSAKLYSPEYFLTFGQTTQHAHSSNKSVVV